MSEHLSMESMAGPRSDRAISALERVLPAIGGTVTEVLELYVGEPLRATRLYQQTSLCTEPVPVLALGAGERVLERRVLLRGAATSVPVLYAESLIALDRLAAPIRQGLLTTDQPIGRLIRDNRLEAFREHLSCARIQAPRAAAYFGTQAQVPHLVRTYRMSSAGRPIMLITEWFPC